MAVQAQYLAYVLEQLAGLERMSTRRMFGAVGLYSGELFFGLIDDDTLFFKTGESNATEYQVRKMPRFMPPANRPLGPMGYHQVPADIIEDGEALVAWARKAVAVALAARAKPRTAKKKPASGKAARKTPPARARKPVRPAKPRRQR